MITGNVLQRLSIVAALILSGLSMQVMAQEEAESAEQEKDAAPEQVAEVQKEERRGPQLDQIVVTARKTEESLQDVPLAISAFSAQEIEDAAIVSFQDVADFTPGLTFSNLYGQQLPVPVIRGVAPVSVFDENAAAVFVDGIFVSAREGLDLNQLDLERIEVVKGPQAAMYGRNSFSGAVNFITAKPTDEFQGSAEWQVGTRDRIKGKLTISGPIIPGLLRGRFSMAHDEWAGSYNNQNAGGPDIGGYEKNAWVGGLDFLPTDSLEARVTVYISNDHFDAPAMAAIPANCQDRGEVTGAENSRLQSFCNRVPSMKQNDLTALAQETGEDTDTLRGNLEINWDVGIGTFSLLAGHSDVKNSGVLGANVGSGVWDAAYEATTDIPGLNIIKLVEDFSIYQFSGLQRTIEDSVEIRYATPVENRIRADVGVYGYQVESKSMSSPGARIVGELPPDFVSFCPCFAGSDIGDPGTAAFGVGDDVFLPWMEPIDPSGLGDITNLGETESWAVFGAFEADITSTLEARIEARYTEEEKTNTSFGTDPGPLQNNTWGFTTWRATLKWAPTDDFMVYTGVAKAEKSGSFDTVRDADDNIIVTIVDPESLLAYELGTKFSLFDNRINVDVSTYYQEWSDMVIPFLVEVENDQPTSQSFNAGDSVQMGIEADINIAVTDYLTTRVGFSWADSEMKNGKISTFKDFPLLAPDGDISGKKLHRQSEWTANASATYRAPFLATQYEWYARADVLYTGSQYIMLDNLGTVPGRTRVNFRAGFDSEKYQLEFWADNLFNSSKATSAHRNVLFQNTINGTTDFFNTFFPLQVFYTGQNLRTFGVTGRIRF